MNPLLYGAATACNTELPGGEVVEWFDFGQFVELLAVDAAGISHPVVLANQSELARAAGQLGEGADVPLRMVDVLGGIPLSEIADDDNGNGERALDPIDAAIDVVVPDVDKLIRDGQISSAGATFKVTLSQDDARRLADGERLVHEARRVLATGTEPVTIRLAPVVEDVAVPDVESLLAAGTVTVERDTLTLALEPAEVTALLAGHTVIVRTVDDGRTRLVRLNQPQDAAGAWAQHPARSENMITDLAAFLAKPVVDGDDGRPFRVPLTKRAIAELRASGTVTIGLEDGFALTVTVARVAAQIKRENGGGESFPGEDEGGDDGGGGEQDEVPPPSPAETTVETISSESPTAQEQFGTVLKAADGAIKIWKFLDAQEPLPPAKPPPKPRPPFHLRVALFLPWRQTWTMKGLSRGRLLQSLSLAPQEDATIELQTWERHRKTLEQSTQTDTEQAIDATDTTKDTSEVYGEVQRQSDFQYQVGGSLKATYRPAAGEIEVGANAQLSGKSAINQVGRNTQGRLHESVVKASTKVRTQRVTKITETVEWGSEQRVTRKIRNPNLCHTLNLDYYEVLAHYDITTEFLAAETKLCAMVENPISIATFNEPLVLGNETALRDALLDRALADGFDAIRLLGAYAEAKLELADRKAAAAQAAKMGTPEKKPPETPVQQPQPTRQEADVLAALKDLRSVASTFNQPLSPENLLNLIGLHAKPGDDTRRQARRWMYKKLVEAKFPNFASTLRDLAGSADAADTAQYTVRLEAARRVAAAIPPPTASPSLGTLNDIPDADKELAGLGAAIHAHMGMPWDWAWWSGRCREEQLYIADDMGIAAAAQRLVEKQTALDATPAVDAAVKQGDAMVEAAGQKQDQQAAEDVLEMKFGLEDVGRARERCKTLLAHLNDHLDYYRFVLFQSLPPSEQLERLMSGSGGALRVGMFEPRVVSMHGRFLAVPLHAAGEDLLEKFRATIIQTLSTIAKATSRVMLPTPGMAIESRLGRCSACEDYIEKSREVELRRLTSVARQAELEASRMEARVAAKQLEDPKPTPAPLNVRVEDVNGSSSP